eukprot:scaffold122321_cov42-Phaeocystis_antarctica.AAC.1
MVFRPRRPRRPGSSRGATLQLAYSQGEMKQYRRVRLGCVIARSHLAQLPLRLPCVLWNHLTLSHYLG